MLSIRFSDEKEWWVRSGVFERMFQTAVEIGEMPAALLNWNEIIYANGGFDISRTPELDATAFTKAMISAARHNLDRLEREPDRTQDFGHPQDLQRFLSLFDHS